MSKKKIQISIDDELLKKLDNTASNLHMSRSGLISFSVSCLISDSYFSLFSMFPPNKLLQIKERFKYD